MTPEERTARRRLSALVRNGVAVLTDGGLEIWREDTAGEFKASAEEISADLTVLGVDHAATAAGRPAYRSASRTPARGIAIRIDHAHLRCLADRLPPAAASALLPHIVP